MHFGNIAILQNNALSRLEQHNRQKKHEKLHLKKNFKKWKFIKLKWKREKIFKKHAKNLLCHRVLSPTHVCNCGVHFRCTRYCQGSLNYDSRTKHALACLCRCCCAKRIWHSHFVTILPRNNLQHACFPAKTLDCLPFIWC